MAEALPAFVARRRPEWKQLEAMLARLQQGSLTLDEVWALDALYRRVAADLAVAQGAYRNTDVARYLNRLCGAAFAAIYRPRRPPARSLADFYRFTFPDLVRRTLGPIQLAAALLTFSAVLGFATVWLQPDAATTLVPAELRAIIARGELWTDSALSHRTPSAMATEIFFNNLKVMFTAFAFGVTAGVLTVLVLLHNGLFLGATLAAAVNGGVGPNLFSFISGHGPVELSLIAIAGGAGLHLGQALVDPGERTRATALRAHARDAVQLVLGAAPFMVAIGVVEGFVSPGDFFPWPLKLLLGALTGVGFWRWLLTAPPRP